MLQIFKYPGKYIKFKKISFKSSINVFGFLWHHRMTHIQKRWLTLPATASACHYIVAKYHPVVHKPRPINQTLRGQVAIDPSLAYI